MLTPVLSLGELDLPVLVFGGPYSNLAATHAILSRAAQSNIPPHRIVCTGDVVAYGAEPEQTSQLIRASGIHVVMGNCEESLASGSEDCGCGFSDDMLCSTLSQQWYRYAMDRITGGTRRWMGSLPRVVQATIGGYHCSFIHGGVNRINRFVFASTDSAIKYEELNAAGSDVVIGGHCGLPFGEIIDTRAWLNAGVIGLPANDGQTSVWYLRLDKVGREIECSWHRLAYDYRASYDSMQAAGLTDYADSLISGLWPSMDILPQDEQASRGQTRHPPAIRLPARI